MTTRQLRELASISTTHPLVTLMPVHRTFAALPQQTSRQLQQFHDNSSCQKSLNTPAQTPFTNSPLASPNGRVIRSLYVCSIANQHYRNQEVDNATIHDIGGKNENNCCRGPDAVHRIRLCFSLPRTFVVAFCIPESRLTFLHWHPILCDLFKVQFPPWSPFSRS